MVEGSEFLFMMSFTQFLIGNPLFPRVTMINFLLTISAKITQIINSGFVKWILPTCFDNLEESFSLQFKRFCLPMKTSCHPAQNVDEFPELGSENYSENYH